MQNVENLLSIQVYMHNVENLLSIQVYMHNVKNLQLIQVYTKRGKPTFDSGICRMWKIHYLELANT